MLNYYQKNFHAMVTLTFHKYEHIFVKLKVPLQVKVKVRTWSGQVSSNSDSNSNSKVGPELYTKIGFHTISKQGWSILTRPV